MSVMRLVACVLACAVLAPTPAHAKKGKTDDEPSIKDDAASDDEASTSDDSDSDSEQPKKAPKDKGPSRQDKDFQKQDLNGHDLATSKKENLFEKDRFFVDKSDTDKTEKGTLVQGSLTSTSFGYHESGGNVTVPMGTGSVPSNSQFNRLFTDLRLQTDFRHIAAGKWDARIDVRGRVVTDPGTVGNYGPAFTPGTNSTVQSGFLGQNELELKELWLVRNGKRSDVFFGRQFIPDLAAVKIDGLRIDYASSEKFTLLGFGGLYPIRGSRSITTDYSKLYSSDGMHTSAGRFTGAGGFGAAYRTADMYGSFGGVVLAPFSSESPRVFGTATGYWRVGPKLDFYHFVVLDAVGSNAVNTGLTNLSAGINYKPDQRLRGTLSFNRVDTETLNVQAQAFLSQQDGFTGTINNEAYLIRIATNEARASLSAGLGQLQRFELTAAATYRYRGDQTLAIPGQAMALATLPAASSIEVYFSATDRHSFADLRLGADFSRIFKVGDATYQRTSSSAFRVFVARELANGHGEWELEGAYSTTKDDDAGKNCAAATIPDCFGAAQDSILSLGTNVFYRLNRDWFGMVSAFLNRTTVKHVDMAGATTDPTVTGLTGFLRLAYRF